MSELMDPETYNDLVLTDTIQYHHEARGAGAMTAINPTVQRWVQNAREAPEEFWASAANELPWFRKWDRVFERDFPSLILS